MYNEARVRGLVAGADFGKYVVQLIHEHDAPTAALVARLQDPDVQSAVHLQLRPELVDLPQQVAGGQQVFLTTIGYVHL